MGSVVLDLQSVLSIVAGWRESGGLGLSCGGKIFWGRVEKKQDFHIFNEHQRYLHPVLYDLQFSSKNSNFPIQNF